MRRVKGSLRHLRRETAPGFWPILRKEFVWAVKPRPGPHPLWRSIPLAVLLRDVLGYVSTLREARRVLNEGSIEVDGRVVKDYKFPVGLMDVVHIRPTDEYFRIVPHKVRVLAPVEIGVEEAGFKLCRIEGKTMVKGGNIQLNLHDGRNILVKLKDSMNPVEDVYKTFDTLQVSVPRQEILSHIRFREGVLAVVIGGANVGAVGRIRKVTKIFKKKDAIVELETGDGGVIRTILNYVFPIGEDKPLVTLGQV